MTKQESVFIHADESVIEVKFGKLPEEFDTDDILRIDYSNIYGEKVTISTLVNKLGILVEQAEYNKKSKDLELKVYDAETRKTFRREAIDNGGKFKIQNEWVKLTKDSLDEAMEALKALGYSDKEVQRAAKDLQKETLTTEGYIKKALQLMLK